MKTLLVGATVSLLLVTSAHAWNNGQSGNTATDTAGECADPPYATHDWIAEHALELLPDEEKEWLAPHRALYLIGTEAPDHKGIPASCGAPNGGYDDRSAGHSIEWNASATQMLNDRPAVRAQEEYSKAAIAFGKGQPAHAAYFLGAMAHYIGDVSQYGHSFRDEVHHGDYESWAAQLTDSFDAGTFESAITRDSLVNRTPFVAARRISHDTFAGRGRILRAPRMDALFSTKPPAFIASVEASLNLAVNELADVLHSFFLNVVSDDQ